jgi:replicative DNA helicase
MTDNATISDTVKKYTELFCPAGVPPTGGEQLDTGNSYPNTDNIDIEAHITGKATFALDLAYTDSNGQEVCKIGVFDIDQLDDEGLATAIEIRDYLRERGITTLLAFSGRKGYHVYLISEPIPKKVMCEILKKIKAKFPFKGELIPGDEQRSKIAPCGHQVAGNWSYLFEDAPEKELIPLSGELPDGFHEKQYGILRNTTPTPANIMIAIAIEDIDPQEKKKNLDNMVPHLDKLQGKLPPCIRAMYRNGGSKAIGTYDKNNLTLATCCNSCGKDKKTAIAFGKTMANASVNGPVETKKTKAEKIKHFKSALASPSAKNTPFNCAYMLAAKKELNFDCKKCAAQPIGVKETIENNGIQQTELESALADSFLAYVTQNGLSKEHINPSILPDEEEGMKHLGYRSLIYRALTDGANTQAKVAKCLDKNKSIPKQYKNKTVTMFAKFEKAACVNDSEWERILERAVDFTQKYEINQKASELTDSIYTGEKDIATLNAEYTHASREILADSQKNAITPMSSLAPELIEALMGADRNVIPTPFDTVNALLGGGFHNGKLYVLVAQPGGGKTTWAAHCADHAARNGVPVIFIPMEMGRDQLFIYSIARLGEINSAKIETNQKEVRGQVESRIVETVEDYFANEGLHMICTEGKFNTSPATIEIAISSVRAMLGLEKADPLLVVIDYLQLLSTGNDQLDFGQNETTKISELAVKVKQLTRDQNVAVLAISDVTKKEQEGSWSNKELSLNSPRGSNRIAHAADCVLALYSEPAHSQGGKAESDPWDVFIEKFKDDAPSREFIERLAEKKESTELGGDGSTVFSRLELIKNRGGQGRGNQIMMYHRSYHKFEPVEIEGHAQAERRA